MKTREFMLIILGIYITIFLQLNKPIAAAAVLSFGLVFFYIEDY